MTNTEKLQTAWNVLQSKRQISAMLEEVNAQQDEISKAIARLDQQGAAHLTKNKAQRMDNLLQQLQLSGISLTELIDHIENPPRKRRTRQTVANRERSTTATAKSR